MSKDESLKPCPNCGKEVEIKYIAGLSKELRKAMQHPFAHSKPTWYICCACGHNMATLVKYGTYEEQQKAKRYLIKAWNERKEVDSLEVPDYEKY